MHRHARAHVPALFRTLQRHYARAAGELLWPVRAPPACPLTGQCFSLQRAGLFIPLATFGKEMSIFTYSITHVLEPSAMTAQSIQYNKSREDYALCWNNAKLVTEWAAGARTRAAAEPGGLLRGAA